MKHLSYYIHPFVLNITIAIIAIICGLYAHYNTPRLTDFEVILSSISVFAVIKGIITFITKVWLKEFGLWWVIT